MTMRSRFPLVAPVLLALALGGCATTKPYGNFVAASVTLDPQPLAAQAVGQLAALWPPARTRFELKQPTPDAFGVALVGKLRTAGYAVLEAGPTKPSAAGGAAQERRREGAPEESQDGEAAAGTPAPVALPLRYVLDRDADSGLYRLTLWVGSQSITRPYLEQDRTLMAAGYWTRKE